MARTKAPNVSEHAVALRRAMAVAGLNNGDVATALGVSTRTVVNWTSRSDPTMPSEAIQEQLGKLLPGYADLGDPVEVAIRNSELPPHERTALIAEYQRRLYEWNQTQQRLAN